MPRKLPLFVERFRDRHKKLRFYFRRGKGSRIALPSPDSADFDAAYQAALAGQSLEKKREQDKPGTIAALITSYMRHGEYAGLRASTKKGYASRIEALRTKHGHRSVVGMTRERIVTIIMQPYADRPGAAMNLLKMLRILIRHANSIGWLTGDPSASIKRPKAGEVRSWTDAEIARFEKCWEVGTKQRLAMSLMLYTGQRRSDVHRMLWDDVNSGSIRVTQQKTGHKLVIPVHGELQKVLAVASREHGAIVSNEWGRPFSVGGFSHYMRDAIEKAGLPMDCQPHGLRKAAGRRLAEAGCSANQIMAVLGHKSLSEAERYTRDASQETMASEAMAKLVPKPL